MSLARRTFILAAILSLAQVAQVAVGSGAADGKGAAASAVECLSRCKRSAGSRKEYAAIIDGGSSGSRIRVYEWESLPAGDTRALPDFKETFNQKKQPGVSDYEDKQPELIKYLKELIDAAVEKIPEEARPTADLYFMATAGMRLLLEEKANSMIAKIDGLLADKSFHPLRYRSPGNSRILSGEEEGVFAWISVNYLKNSFKKKNVRTSKTYGILELGGASTQIAFAPTGNILADKFPVLISGVNYDLYVHSYLYYGQNYVDQWVKTVLYNNHTGSGGDVFNPCMVKGDRQKKSINGHEATFFGTGSYLDCQKMLEDFVYHVHEEWKCHPKPCAIGTVYQPTIKRTMDFVAIGAFVHTFNRIDVLPTSGKFSFQTAREKVEKFCGMYKGEVMKVYPPEYDSFTSVPCLIGTYSPLLFTRGYKFHESTEQIYVTGDIDGRNAEWTLGAIIYEYERRPKDCNCHCSLTSEASTGILHSGGCGCSSYMAAALIALLAYLGLYVL